MDSLDESGRWGAGGDKRQGSRVLTCFIQCWHDGLRFKYPRLSRMALDFLTTQPMSAECERLFSAVGLMVTPQRNRLEAHVVGICQVLRSWLRAGIIDEPDPIFNFEMDKANQQLVVLDVSL
jgi:hypothetical protein